MKLRQLIERLRAKLHRHEWIGSAYNGWAIAMEERCSCGARRHQRTLQDANTDVWHDGAHPIAAELRRQGKARTDNWDGAPIR